MSLHGDRLVQLLYFSLESADFYIVLLELLDVGVFQLALLELGLPGILLLSLVHLLSQRLHLVKYKPELSKLLQLLSEHFVELLQ